MCVEENLGKVYNYHRSDVYKSDVGVDRISFETG